MTQDERRSREEDARRADERPIWQRQIDDKISYEDTFKHTRDTTVRGENVEQPGQARKSGIAGVKVGPAPAQKPASQVSRPAGPWTSLTSGEKTGAGSLDDPPAPPVTLDDLVGATQRVVGPLEGALLDAFARLEPADQEVVKGFINDPNGSTGDEADVDTAGPAQELTKLGQEIEE